MCAKMRPQWNSMCTCVRMCVWSGRLEAQVETRLQPFKLRGAIQFFVLWFFEKDNHRTQCNLMSSRCACFVHGIHIACTHISRFCKHIWFVVGFFLNYVNRIAPFSLCPSVRHSVNHFARSLSCSWIHFSICYSFECVCCCKPLCYIFFVQLNCSNNINIQEILLTATK